MGGFQVPGPVLTFRIDAPSLTNPVQEAMNTIKGQARQASQQIADDWKRMSAQLRASISAEGLNLKGINEQRTLIVSTIDKELNLHRQKDVLTTKELANLKAMTLERERQVDALKRGAAIGITAGTGQVISQLQNTARQLAATLGAGLFGVSGGSGLANIGSAFGAGGAVAGGIATLAAAGVGITKMAVDGGKLAVELDNMSKRIGLTTENVVKLRSASEALDIDFDSAITGFRKLDQELTLALSANLPNASSQAKKAGELFAVLGVNVKEAAANPFAAITQLAAAFRTLPDSAVKSSAAVTIFGRGGLALIPVLDKLSPALDATSKSSQDLIRALGGGGAAEAADKLKAQIVNFHNEVDALEVSLSIKVLPALGRLVGWINSLGDSANYASLHNQQQGAREQIAQGVNDQLRARGQQLTGAGQQDLNKFIDNVFRQNRGDVGAISQHYGIDNQQNSFQDFISSISGKSGDIEKFKASVDASGQAAAGASKLQDELAKVLGTTGERASKAAEALERIDKSFSIGFFEMLSRSPNRNDSFEKQQQNDEVMDRLLNRNSLASVDAANPLFPGGGSIAPAAPFTGIPAVPKPLIDPDALLKQINSEHDDIFSSEIKKYRDHYEEMLAAIDEAVKGGLGKQLISQQEYNAAKLKLDEDLAKKIEGLNKKYEEEAGKLFDDLIGGKTKDFAKTLQKDLEEAFLAPVKKQFETTFGKLLSGISRGVSGDDTGKVGTASTTTVPGGVLGKIEKWLGLGSLSSTIGPGGTAGTFAGAIGADGKVSGTSGQSGTSIATLNVNAQIVNIGGPGSNVGGTSPTLNGGTDSTPLSTGTVGDYLSSLISGGSFFGNNNPFGGSTSAGGGASGDSSSSGLGNFLGAGGTGILGGLSLSATSAEHGNVSGEAMGASVTAQSIVKGLVASGKIDSGTGDSINAVLGGAGLLASGLAKGGAMGVVDDAAGGAEIGAQFAGVFGAAVGGLAGAALGGVRALFGSKSWAQKVQEDMKKQFVQLPPSEQFAFASNGSIASTLNTGAAQSGNTFSQYQLPSNTPFTAKPIFGPLTNRQKQELSQIELGMNPNEPFGGFPASNPFTGQDPAGYRAYPNTPPNSPAPQVIFNLPAFISPETAHAALSPLMAMIAQGVARQGTNSSSGLGAKVRGLVTLP